MNKIKKLVILGCLIMLITGCKDIFTRENETFNYLSGKYYV